MAIENWKDILRAKIEEIPGLAQVHDYEDLPGTIGAFPTAIIMPASGRIEYSQGGPGLEFIDVVITIYTAGQILPEAMSQAVPFISLIRDKLAGNVQLGGTVNQIMPSGEGNWFDGPGQVTYGTKNHIGIVFRYTVKESVGTDFTVSA